MPNKKMDNIFDLGNMMDMENKGEKMDTSVDEVSEEIENLSFVKGTGRKDRNPDDPFAQLGL